MPRAAAKSSKRSDRELFEGYAPLAGSYDEFFGSAGRPHRTVEDVVKRVGVLGRREFRRRQQLADATFMRSGVTFSVYNSGGDVERIFPFDLIPRVVSQREWTRVQHGLTQRIRALNLFLADVYAKTTHGPSPMDVIYRRVDDEYLDPTVFREESLLGVPGLFGAYAKGNVALVNAIGNGVADDKGIYPYVPDMIRFYLSEEAELPQVRTYICARDDDRRYVLEHIEDLVVKSVNEAGGYGMLVGPRATKKEHAAFRDQVREDGRNFIAQPLVELSACPTWTRSGVEPRRVDLRPYIVTGKRSWVLPGGLTRVALRKGSYVVNSSQGGGSKDTWVVEEPT